MFSTTLLLGVKGSTAVLRMTIFTKNSPVMVGRRVAVHFAEKSSFKGNTSSSLERPLVCSFFCFMILPGFIVDVYYILFVLASYDDKMYPELIVWKANIDDYVGYEEAGSFQCIEEKM